MFKPALSVLLALLPAIWAQGAPGAEAPTTAQRPAGAKRNVLILHSYHASYNWTAELERGLEKPLLAQPYEVEIWTEYLDAKRVSGEDNLARMRSLLANKYSGQRLDVVIACDDDAVAFLLADGEPLFGDVPVVFCGIANQALIARLPRHLFTGLTEYVDMRPWVDLALRLRPALRHLVIVTDASPNGAAIRDGLTTASRDYRDVRFDYLDGSSVPFEEILARLRRLDRNTLVIASLFTHDATGRYLPSYDAGASIAAAAPVPVISPNSSILGQGVLLGNANNGFEHGRRAAALALRVLSGVAPSAVPIAQHTEQAVVVDDGARRRWDIPLNRLPEGATIVNRSKARELYEDNRLLIWSCAAFLVLQACIIFVLALNIGRRRRAEQALRINQAMLEHSQRLAHVGSWQNDLSGGPLHWSPEVYRIFGIPASEPVGFERLLSIVHPDDRERIRAVAGRLSGLENRRTTEYRIVRPDGSIRFVLSSAEWAVDRLGRRVIGGALQDITELKEIEADLRHAQRVESLGNLAGGVAHDFNNLLTVINGYTQFILSGLTPDDPSRAFAEEVLKAAERAALLTRQLLAFSRRQMMQPQVLDLNTVVHGIESLVHPLIGESVGLTLRLHGEPCPLLADRTQIEQVLLNLASNARDAMPNGGSLTISTRTHRQQQLSSWDGLEIAPGDYVVLEVSDTGTGMDAATREHIFEPFFTTKEVGKGTGLGLSSVYGIVKQSGGFISVSSLPGKGSTFRLLFPTSPALAVP